MWSLRREKLGRFPRCLVKARCISTAQPLVPTLSNISKSPNVVLPKQVIGSPSSSHDPSTIYVNPICKQMDQRIIKCSSPEDVLTILATHRGVLFVHNLVTAISSLAQMSFKRVSFNTSKKNVSEELYVNVKHDELLSDPRYSLLIQDLVDQSHKLDLQSIDTILSSLQKLDHCHFKLFGALLKRIYGTRLTQGKVSIALSIGQTLQWGGFGKADAFFNQLGEILSVTAPYLPSKDLLNAAILFSKLPSIHPEVMGVLASTIKGSVGNLSNRELGIAAIAVSEYGESIKSASSCTRSLAEAFINRESESRDLIRVAISLRRTNTLEPQLLRKAWAQTCSDLRNALQFREQMEPSLATISDIASLLDSVAHFGLCEPADLRDVFLPYISDHIDLVTEESAIRILFALSTAAEAVTAANGPYVSILLRKIASATDSWERHKSKLLTVFFAKSMQFDFVDAELRQFVVQSCLSHWLMSRRGYSVPYPELSESLYEAVRDFADEECLFNEWIPHSPFNADVVFPNEKVCVLVLSRFSDVGQPVGIDLVQVKLIERLGWTVIPIDRKRLIELPLHTAVQSITDSLKPFPNQV